MSETTPEPTERLTDPEGRSYDRTELNGHWVRYTFLDEAGLPRRTVAFPRVPIISDEAIAVVDDSEADPASSVAVS